MTLDRYKRAKLNTLCGLLKQIITIICGFILPRFYLVNYGSQVYGIVSSITQFLSFVTLMELGMGAVVQTAFYKPLAEKNNIEISKIIKSATQFFNKVAITFGIYTLILAIIYPMFIQNKFGFLFEASLVIIISISSLAEYFFGITYRLLLMSDQLAFITLGLQSVGLILNFVICIVLMQMGAPIHIVKLASSIVLLLRPIGQVFYVNKHYHIDKNVTFEKEPINQKWNGVAQHVAYYITNNTDTIVLSIFSTLENVAIYAVYNMIASGIKELVLTLNSGMGALFGNLLANKEVDELIIQFRKFEWQIHAIVTLLFSCVGLLIVPFITVYTQGISDADYVQPMFAILITLAQATYCIRLPYDTMVNAAGHYKQTQLSSIIEMCLNLGITIILVSKYGLIGAAIGTLVALSYRTIYLAFYLSKRTIINYNFFIFLKNVVIDIIEVMIIIGISHILNFHCENYMSWFKLAICIFLVSFSVVLIVNLIFHKDFGKR